MRVVSHASNNMVLTAPPGMDNCDPAPATMIVEGEQMIATFWQPSPEELAMLNANGSVVLYIWGHAHPPVAVGVTG